MVAYFSKTFSAAERNYCVTRKELGGGDKPRSLPPLCVWRAVYGEDRSYCLAVAEVPEEPGGTAGQIDWRDRAA